MVSFITIVGVIAIYFTCCGFIELYEFSAISVALMSSCLVFRPLILVGLYYGLMEYDFHIAVHIALVAVLFFFACFLLNIIRGD